MGYTHYWEQFRDLTDDEWSRFIEHVNFYAANEGWNILYGPSGTGRPIVQSDKVMLNGDARLGLAHDTFAVYKSKAEIAGYSDTNGLVYGATFNLCKTNRKPYDKYVVLLLSHLKNIANDAIRLSSDGGMGVFNLNGPDFFNNESHDLMEGLT